MQCRACQTKTKDILSLGEQSIPFGSSDKKYPLDLVKCGSCHLVQLKNTVPQEVMYNDSYGYKSGINETIKADLKEIIEKALKLVPNPSKALDCGANDGELLKNYPDETYKVAVEPVEKFHDELLDIPHTALMGTFWPVKQKNCDIITVVSCFYDFPKPNEAVAALKDALAEDGIVIIQQNYLPKMLANNAYDNICHEHLEYYSLLSLEHLLNKHGLDVFRVEENSINGGSFRTYVCHNSKRKVEQSVKDMRATERKLRLDTEKPYYDFSERVNHLARDLHRRVREIALYTTEPKTVYAYGASTRGAVIVQFARLTSNAIKAVVERNPEKVGKEYFGIPIISEEEAKNNPPDFKLILPWFHPSIAEREKGDIPIIIPLPEVRFA